MSEATSSPDLVIVAGAGVILALAAVVVAYLKWRKPPSTPS